MFAAVCMMFVDDARRFCHGVRAVHTTKNKTNLNDFDFGIYEVAEKVVLSNAIKHG